MQYKGGTSEQQYSTYSRPYMAVAVQAVRAVPSAVHSVCVWPALNALWRMCTVALQPGCIVQGQCIGWPASCVSKPSLTVWLIQTVVWVEMLHSLSV